MEIGTIVLRTNDLDHGRIIRAFRIELLTWNKIDLEFTLIFVEIFWLEFGIIFGGRD